MIVDASNLASRNDAVPGRRPGVRGSQRIILEGEFVK